jgi:hypothetical protein
MVQTVLTWCLIPWIGEAKTGPEKNSHPGNLRLRVGRVTKHKKIRKQPILANRYLKALCPLPRLFVASESAASGLFDRPGHFAFLCCQVCSQKAWS